MDLTVRIVRNPAILSGKPTIQGTRISVELVLGWLAQGMTLEWVLEQYPHITREDVLACIAYAQQAVVELPEVETTV